MGIIKCEKVFDRKQIRKSKILEKLFRTHDTHDSFIQIVLF